MLRTATLSVTAGVVALVLGGCTDKAAAPQEPLPTHSPTQATSAPTATPAPTIPAYLRSFTPKERDGYGAAVDDFERFSDRQAELYGAGKATGEARRYYRKATADWRTYWAKLRDFAAQGYRTVGRGDTLQTRPAAIRLDDDGGGQVGLRVCSVAAGVEVLQNGAAVPQPSPRPTVVQVRMVLLPGEANWRMLSEGVGARC